MWIFRLIFLLFLVSCSSPVPTSEMVWEPVILDLQQANRLATLPLKCLQHEYPNKLNQTLQDSSSLASPRDLHPSFYGCFDWHSSVHGHWMLVRLLKSFPQMDRAQEARDKLQANLASANVAQELLYFQRPQEKSFERTYGWAWLLKLSEELYTWEDALGQELYQNLLPLTDLIVQRYQEFLPRLNYPIRVGEHTNTAFGLSFAWDYAKTTGNQELMQSIKSRALAFYQNDHQCPVSWEPSGYDFLSPCLEEIDIMRRILTTEQLQIWLKKFMPELSNQEFNLEPGKVSDRQDGKLVHLDGVNFSRAWCLFGLANTLPEYEHLQGVAYQHISYSLPNVIDGSYEGEHWLASFALFALFQAPDFNP